MQVTGNENGAIQVYLQHLIYLSLLLDKIEVQVTFRKLANRDVLSEYTYIYIFRARTNSIVWILAVVLRVRITVSHIMLSKYSSYGHRRNNIPLPSHHLKMMNDTNQHHKPTICVHHTSSISSPLPLIERNHVPEGTGRIERP